MQKISLLIVLFLCILTLQAQVHVHPKVEPVVHPKVNIALPEEEKIGWEPPMISPSIPPDIHLPMPSVAMPNPAVGKVKMAPLELEKLKTDSALKAFLNVHDHPATDPFKNLDMADLAERALAEHFDSIESKAIQSDFGDAILAIYADVPNDFSNIKGTKHTAKVDSMHPEVVWYDSRVAPKEAIQCVQYLSKHGNEVCNCKFYFGADEKEANAAMDNLLVQTKSALGDAYCYTTLRSLFTTETPADAQSLTAFGKKEEYRLKELPVIAAYLQKTSENKFFAHLLFYKTFF